MTIYGGTLAIAAAVLLALLVAGAAAGFYLLRYLLRRLVAWLHGEIMSAEARARSEIASAEARVATAVRNAMAAERQASERVLMVIQTQLARLSFAQGSRGDPADIVLGELDSYDQLDQNWQSFRHTAGKRPSSLMIDGERARTAVIVTLGQSNAANHGAGIYVARRRVDNFNIYDGKCYHAADPLLGASGEEGNFATRLGDKLIEAGLFDRVIFAPIAMGGTTVEQWADEGMFNRRIVALLRRLYDAKLTVDFILWHQGEGNPGMGDVEGRQYRKNLHEVIATFRRYGVDAPFFVALATRCGDAPHPNAVNIRAGQLGCVDPAAGIFLGPDTDKIGVEHRWDKCHFDSAGLDLAASLWLESLVEFKRGVPGAAVRSEPRVSAAGSPRRPSPVTAKLLSAARDTSARATIADPDGGFSGMMAQLVTAFTIETSYRKVIGPVLMVDERMAGTAAAASEVPSRLIVSAPISGAGPEWISADMIVAWEGLRHAFHPRAALDRLCEQLRPGGRLIYAQRLTDHYIGLTPKWLLDYFVASGYADCRVYLLWPPEGAPAVATFDYQWILDTAKPVYNPMWDNITHAAAVLVVAEKGIGGQAWVPSQENYRSDKEWKRYAEKLRSMLTSPRPWHLTGAAPANLPPGCRTCYPA